MAVTVHFTDGNKQTFREADSAALRGPVFVVSRRAANKGLVELSAFEAGIVALAEVHEDGIVREVVVGLGRKA